MTNGDELDAVLLDEGGHVVLNPANVVYLASHLGLHDFVVDGRVTNLEYGHARFSSRSGSFSLAGLMDQAMDGFEEIRSALQLRGSVQFRFGCRAQSANR